MFRNRGSPADTTRGREKSLNIRGPRRRENDSWRRAALGRRARAPLLDRQRRWARLSRHCGRPRNSMLGCAQRSARWPCAKMAMGRLFRSRAVSTLSISSWRDRPHRRPRTRQTQQSIERWQGRQTRPFSSRLDGYVGGRTRQQLNISTDPDFSLHKLDGNIIVSNGPCWSPGGSTFCFAELRKR